MGVKVRKGIVLSEVIVAVAVFLIFILFVIPATISFYRNGSLDKKITEKQLEMYSLANKILAEKFNDPCLTEGTHCESDSCCDGFDGDLRYLVENEGTDLKKVTIYSTDYPIKFILFKGSWK